MAQPASDKKLLFLNSERIILMSMPAKTISRFKNLAEDSLGSKNIKKKICILTPDIAGLIRNGGVGTAYHCLAETLASDGHDVTILFTSIRLPSDPTFDVWQKRYWSKGIRLISTPEPPMELSGIHHARLSYAAFLYLKDNHFDIVHAPEMNGLAYYSLVAKKLGLGFGKTIFLITMHGPSEWHRKYNDESHSHPNSLYFRYVERKSVEFADVVTAPSQYILDWAQENGFQLPKRVFVEQNLLPIFEEELYSGSRKQFDEIVFFGRIETRKGIEIFCDAVEELPAKLSESKKITFLGSSGEVHRIKGVKWLEKRTSSWVSKPKIITNFDRAAALQYLTNRKVLVVLASIAENLPYSGIECIDGEIPFIATRIPAFQELISPAQHDKVLFKPTAEALAEKLVAALDEGLPKVKFAKNPLATRRNWLAWHDRVTKPNPKKPAKQEKPLVSVCIVHRNRSGLLKDCVAAFEQQTYPNFEVILVDNKSTNSDCIKYLRDLKKLFAERGWRILREKENHGPGKARNIAAKLAKGEFLVFADDDNIPKTHQLETFVRAILHAKADIVTCPLDLFTGTKAPSDSSTPKQRWLPVGDAVELGAFENVFGDMTSIVRKDVFFEVGGLKEIRKPSFEDYEFFIRSVFKGKKLMVAPEGLVWYRRHDNGLFKSNLMENVQLITDAYAEAAGDKRFGAILDYAVFRSHTDAIKVFHRSKKTAQGPLFSSERSDFFADRSNFSHEIFSISEASELNRLKFHPDIKIKKTKQGPIIHDDKGGGTIELPKMDLQNVQQIMVELDMASHNHSLVFGHYTIMGLGKAKRKATTYSAYRPGQKNVQLIFNARSFSGTIKIAPLSGPGSCLIKSIVVFAT